jgi:hypothetical protein
MLIHCKADSIWWSALEKELKHMHKTGKERAQTTLLYIISKLGNVEVKIQKNLCRKYFSVISQLKGLYTV